MFFMVLIWKLVEKVWKILKVGMKNIIKWNLLDSN